MKDSGYVGGKSSHRFDRFHNELKIFSLNACSLLPKIESLKLLVEAEDLIAVICVIETWLSAEMLDAEISIQGYQCFRRDRNWHGGGIVVYVRDCLSTTPIMDNADLELLILSLTVNNRKTTIETFYCPPNLSSELMDACIHVWKTWTLPASQISSSLVTSILISVIHLIIFFVSCLTLCIFFLALR